MQKDKVTLQCQGESIEVDIDVIKKSTILKNMIEDTGKDGEIKIPNIEVPILKKVIEYCEHYKNSEPKEIEKPLRSKNLLEHGATEWDVKYIETNNMEELTDLIVAASFLDIESLLDLGSAYVASQIKGKSVQEIRDMFGIENDFTPEEEK